MLFLGYHTSVSRVLQELAAWLPTIPQVLAETFSDRLVHHAAQRMAQFVGDRKFEKLGDGASPYLDQLSGTLGIVDEERFLKKCFPRF